MRVVYVIEAGGTRGAFTVGRLCVERPKMDVVVASSTGGFIGCLAAADEYDLLEHAYGNIENINVFSNKPFTVDGKINILNLAKKIITRKHTIGDTKKFRKFVEYYFTESVYNKINNLGREVIVNAINDDQNPSFVEYFSTKKHSYEVFLNALLATGAVPLVMDEIDITVNNHTYPLCDAGFVEPLPIRYALKRFRQNPKVIYTHHVNEKVEVVKGKFHRNLFTRALNVWNLSQDMHRRSALALVKGKKNVTINYLPYKIEGNALVFKKKELRNWIQKGKDYANSLKND